MKAIVRHPQGTILGDIQAMGTVAKVPVAEGAEVVALAVKHHDRMLPAGETLASIEKSISHDMKPRSVELTGWAAKLTVGSDPKGIPLRIRGTGGLNGTVASVDSELTLLYRKLLGVSVAPVGRGPRSACLRAFLIGLSCWP